MRYVVLDTETTGIDPEKDGIVELAAKHTNLDDKFDDLVFEQLCNPGIRIPPEAMAVHHITNEMIQGMESSQQVLRELAQVMRINYTVHLVAHNAAFDRGMLTKLDPSLANLPWICTYRCALHLFPTAPGHSNQVLRYWLGVDSTMELPPGLYPHRALYDVMVTDAILRVMLENHTLDELAELSKQPVVLTKVRFGKYKGYLWKDVPRDYLQWAVRQQDIDSDVRHTAMHYLRQDRLA